MFEPDGIGSAAASKFAQIFSSPAVTDADFVVM